MAGILSLGVVQEPHVPNFWFFVHRTLLQESNGDN